jgi:hypothetical protein
MNKKTVRNFWLDVALFLLLGLDIAMVRATGSETTGIHTGLHIHVLINVLLGIGCLMHITMHWGWYQAVLSGKAKGKTKLIMTSFVMIMMLLAGLSGNVALSSTAASNFHSFTGSMALIGLSIHGIKHIRWMVLTGKRLIATPETSKPAPHYG